MTERVVARLRGLPDVEEAPSQWTGGFALWIDGREFVHLHGGEIEIRLTRKLISRLDDPRVARRTRTSDWVIVPVDQEELIVDLARQALEANRRHGEP